MIPISRPFSRTLILIDIINFLSNCSFTPPLYFEKIPSSPVLSDQVRHTVLIFSVVLSSLALALSLNILLCFEKVSDHVFRFQILCHLFSIFIIIIKAQVTFELLIDIDYLQACIIKSILRR